MASLGALQPQTLPSAARRQWHSRQYVQGGPVRAHRAVRSALPCCAWSTPPAPSGPAGTWAITPPTQPARRVQCSASSAATPAPEPSSRAPYSEAVKIGSLGMLFFSSTFIYTILQNLKDSIIVSHVGAEVLPFLEAYGVLPMSFAFFVFYNKLNQILPEKWVYSAVLLPLLSFYALFGTFLYPNAASLHPTHLIDSMRAALPAGLVGIASMIVYWTYSLFFILGELWGGVAISLLFWGLADEVCTVREAESVYPLLGIIANIGLVLSGAWIKYINSNAPRLAELGLMPVQALIMTILAVACVLVVIKTFIHNSFVQADTTTIKKGVVGKEKPKKTLRESLEILRKSPKVNNLAILVISYFVSQKLFDFAWKAELRVLYPTPEDCQRVLASVSQWTGIVTIALMATSKFVFRLGGWAAAAVATPLSILVTGGMFFASAIAMQGNSGLLGFLGPQAVAVLIGVAGFAGAAGRVASRAPKYSLFDPAKEMVYITMSKEEKKEGKAAVDLLGSYFGKSGASWIMQGLVLVMGTLTAAMPIIGFVHFAICLAWIRSTFSLAALMKQATEQEDQTNPVLAAASAADASISVPLPAAAATRAAAIPTTASSTNGDTQSGSPEPAMASGSPTNQTNGHETANGSEKTLLPCCPKEGEGEYGYSEAYELCEPGDPCIIHESMWDGSPPPAQTPAMAGAGTGKGSASSARPSTSEKSRS